MAPHDNVARISYSQVFRFDSSEEGTLDYSACSHLPICGPQPEKTVSARTMAMIFSLKQKLTLLDKKCLATKTELERQHSSKVFFLAEWDRLQQENISLRTDREQKQAEIDSKQAEIESLKHATEEWERRVEAAEKAAKKVHRDMDLSKEKLSAQKRQMALTRARREQSECQLLSLKTALEERRLHGTQAKQAYQQLKETISLAIVYCFQHLHGFEAKVQCIISLQAHRKSLVVSTHALLERISSVCLQEEVEALAMETGKHIERQQLLHAMVIEQQAQFNALLQRISQSAY